MLSLKDYIKELSEEELYQLLVQNPLLKEKYDCKLNNAIHLGNTTGPDGHLMTATKYGTKKLEAKSCSLTQKTKKISSSISYSDSSMQTYQNKINHNGELISTTAYDTDGTVLFRHSVEWIHVKDNYLAKIQKSKTKKLTSLNIGYPVYSKAESFQVTYLNEERLNKNNISIPFYNTLKKHHDKHLATKNFFDE